jgi:3-methyladenine DNA glycosylase AlkD
LRIDRSPYLEAGSSSTVIARKEGHRVEPAEDATHLAEQLEERLTQLGTRERAEKERAYLKSDLRHLGTSVPATRTAATQLLRDRPALDREDLLRLAGALWSEPVHECRLAAIEVLAARSSLLLPEDLPLLERLVREARTWALVDGLATKVLGDLRERFPEVLEPTLEGWSRDQNLWLRRASLLAYLVTLRSGRGDFEAFSRKADRMLEEREFFIRKAIGWVLRDTGRRQPDLVIAWLEPRLGRAASLTVREAVRHLPELDRERLLAKR